ncbi:hypothetical protein NDK47_21055 [Brevibacillus ruminantium]|uniref:Phenazine biosynthesis protein n=1 Tax=Brevibacillus ruminantium TaxID=2950604 RepID=A0ABY4WF33_9BACL|nr:hypothetical protein [Brevibacillus ruminantium]USG64607.1 hypothetical protein NDK47_21055 [Brevibacillus ruminantium]
MNDIFNRDFNDLPDLDELIVETMRWHFSSKTGSPFWLSYRKQLDFDPLTDIKTVEDLKRFPDVSTLWRDIPVRDLIPQGCLTDEWRFLVFESGGTTGAPKRIIEMNSRKRGVEWVNHVLQMHQFPDDGDWIHIGPAGPHAVGRSVGLLAQMRKKLCYYIDFDPRWVKLCIKNKKAEEVKLYIDHVIEQAASILETQPVSVIFATPPVLEEICSRPKTLDLFRKRAKAIIWSGTSISDETLRLLEEEFFPDSKIMGLYGNTMMGIAIQRPPHPGDLDRCVFQTFYPYCFIDVVDPENLQQTVEYGKAGQVKVTLLSRELFLPNNLERDVAVRNQATDVFKSDGLSKVKVLKNQQQSIIEGVY